MFDCGQVVSFVIFLSEFLFYDILGVCTSVFSSEYFVNMLQFKRTKGTHCSVDVVVLAMTPAGFCEGMV